MKKTILKIGGMTCSACSNSLEHFLNKQEKISSAEVNLVLASATICYDDDLSLKELEAIVDKSGFKSLGVYKFDDKNNRHAFFWIMFYLVLTIILMYVTMGHMIHLPMFPLFHPHHNPKYFGVLCLVLTIPYIIYGFDIIKMGFKNLFHLSPNMDTLVTLGIISSFIYSLVNLILIWFGLSDIHHLFFESAAMVIFFVKLGRFLDQRIKNKTKSAVKDLVQITPKMAKIDNHGFIQEITIDQVQVDDILFATSGDKVAVDGIVTDGECFVDEAFITGESNPVNKKKGDKVIAGSILYNGTINYQAKKIGNESTISEIVKMVVEATNTKAKIALLADKVSRFFVPAIMLIAILSFIVYIIVTKDFKTSINVFVSILVVACPCALGLATPLAIVTTVGTLAKQNILIKNGEVLENIQKVDTVVFDKTGTLTYGKLNIFEKFTYVEDLYNEVASLEKKANHPIATAFSSSESFVVDSFETIEGMGIKGIINDDLFFIGNQKLVNHLNIKNEHLNDEDYLKENGCTIVYVIKNNIIHELYGIKDTIRPSSITLIDQLKNKGINVIMLTGDNEQVGRIIASKLGIDNIITNCMPLDKINYLKKLKQDGHNVMMVGDGINDAPSLIEANVGVSLKNATEIAVESSDVVLMNNDLTKILDLFNISKKAIINIKENLFWAFFYNILMIPIAMGALSPLGIQFNPMIASIGMTLSSLCVLLNALRLTKYKKKE